MGECNQLCIAVVSVGVLLGCAAPLQETQQIQCRDHRQILYTGPYNEKSLTGYFVQVDELTRAFYPKGMCRPEPAKEVRRSPEPAPAATESPAPVNEVSRSPEPAPAATESPNPVKEVKRSPEAAPAARKSPHSLKKVKRSPGAAPAARKSPHSLKKVKRSPGAALATRKSPDPVKEVSRSPEAAPPPPPQKIAVVHPR